MAIHRLGVFLMKKFMLLLLIVFVAGAGWLWREWHHITVSPSAAAWSPPVAAAPAVPAAVREPCANYDPLRRAFFGDLHVHTGYSMDAYSRDMHGSVEDAYRFARGESIALGPFDEQRNGSRQVQLVTPLDFAAVTDHAEWMGEVSLCSAAGSRVYDVPECRALRGEGEPIPSIANMVNKGTRMVNVIGFLDRSEAVCGPDNVWCRQSLKDAWEQTQQVAEQYYDRSAVCSFTTFHGYEYSNSSGLSKVHRNVIFRNERVPELPVSSLEQREALGLWEDIDALCNQAAGDCEAIAIPHNPNVANGRAFWVPWKGESIAEQRRQASLRARLEPLVEMMQIKGESECREGMWQVLGEDELCDFEKIRGVAAPGPLDCEDDYSRGAIRGGGCQSRLDFARYALIEGMVEEARIGVNPYRFGMIGSTDSHNASPGDVDEAQYDGCCANTDVSPAQRLDPTPNFAGKSAALRNPGGLVGLWSEDNSRDALFSAMQRREAFATSGPRITPRLFVGAELPENICKHNFAQAGYAAGVPMGGVIETRLETSPVFAAAVSADPRGGLLQRLQMVKVWHDDEGVFHQSVTDIAGNANNGASVDLRDCAVRGEGAGQFCVTWKDPSFDPARAAAWYLRAVENPSCRWSWRQCLEIPEAERPVTCDDPDVPRVIQERAWSSPVWYSPKT